MEKQIGEVFRDYKTESNLKEAIITQMNLIKKVNVLEISLESQEYIEIKEFWFFEKFLRERFQFGNVDIKIKYAENVTIKSIEKEWENIERMITSGDSYESIGRKYGCTGNYIRKTAIKKGLVLPKRRKINPNKEEYGIIGI